MAVIGEPLVTRIKRSASFAFTKKAKQRLNKSGSYLSLIDVTTGLNDDLIRNIKYQYGNDDKDLPDIVNLDSPEDNYVHYRSKKSNAGKTSSRNFCANLSKEVCTKLTKETPSSCEASPSLRNRHFMDAIDNEASCGRSQSDCEAELCSSQLCKTGNSSRKRSSMDNSSAVSDTSDCEVVTCQGRVIYRKYVNNLPLLFVPGIHSALKFRFVKSLDSGVMAEDLTVYVVQLLRKDFDQLFDVLHENLQTSDHDMSCYFIVVNRWISIRTELTQHITKSLMRKLRRSTKLHNSFACYRVLMRALQTFPLTCGVPFSLADLEKAIDELSGFLEFSNSSCNKLYVINMVLRLIFMVNCLENELLHCRLQSKRHVSLSCVCMWLSAEKKFTFLKRIIQVLVDFLKYQESFINYLILADEAQDSVKEDHFNKCVIQMVSALSPLMQRLVVMSQAVSTYPAQTADRIATELASEYSQITLLSHRYEFLESTSVPLIKLKLCQRIFERQYSSFIRTRVCGSLTSLTLDYLLATYMRNSQNAGTKSKPGGELKTDWLPCCVDGKNQPLGRETCEEFSVLLFTIVLSYIQVKKEDYVDCPLWDQTTKKNESSLSTVDINTLKQLPDQVEKLQQHLQEAVGNDGCLTKRTLVFLQKLACLSDIC